jgi:hypothetical protein
MISRAQQCCGNCDAFAVQKNYNPPSGQPRVGACVANPPMPVQVMMPPSIANPSVPQSGVQGVWPPTVADKWCRHWQLATDSEEKPQ